VPDLPSSSAGLVQAFEPSSLLLREGSFLGQLILAGVRVKHFTIASRLGCQVRIHVRSPSPKVRIAVSFPGWHLLGGPPGQEAEGKVPLKVPLCPDGSILPGRFRRTRLCLSEFSAGCFRAQVCSAQGCRLASLPLGCPWGPAAPPRQGKCLQYSAFSFFLR
jgi:hypothetical protein